MPEDISNPLTNDQVASEKSRNLEQQRIILEIAARALENGNRNVDEVWRVAEKIGLKADLIQNLRAYATRAIFRVRGRPKIQEEPLVESRHASAMSDASFVERIEAQILVGELLETLSPTDREIFVRLMNGECCPEIDAKMNLKPRSAEIRLKVCKNALRRLVEKKLKP